VSAQLFPPGIPKAKRLFDLLLTVPGLVLISPLLAVLALLVRLFHGAPVVFTQVRPGYRSQPFTMYKFRSMNEARDEQGALLPDEERLTRFGSFLRASSLDELPELFNVLRGEMSLIGPRPIVMDEIPLYKDDFEIYKQVLPGMTGMWQISGRNDLTYEERVSLDVYYVQNWSIWLDIHILMHTVLTAAQAKGAY